MPGTGIWLPTEDYLQSAGQLWLQQQQQRVQAGQDWAQQQMQQAMRQVQAMVPQAAPSPAPVAQPTPAPMPTPTPAPVPGGVPTPPPVAPPAEAAAPPVPTPPPPTPTPEAPPPAPVAQPSTPSQTTDLTNAGADWVGQQMQKLLGGAAQAAEPTPPPPGGPPPTPAPQVSGGPPSTPQTTPGVPAGPQSATPGDYIDQARQAAAKYGIDPEVFTRQIQQESGFNPSAKSPAGATGIAQFMPQTAQGMGIDPTNPQQSLDAAAKMDAQNLQKYGGDWSKTLAAYNAGPGNVDQYAGVPPFAETQRYVNTILGGAKDVAQQGLSAVNTAIDAAKSQVATRTSQFGLGLSSGDAMAFCGPTAAIAFAQTYGRNPTVDEAKQLAQQVGWNPDQGMAGVGSEVKLLNAMGVDAHATQGVDWATVGRDAAGGNPVIIDTPGHYYYVDGYNAQTGQLHVGTSGTDLKGGSEWMTPDQINGMPQSHGGARAAIFADHPLAQSDGTAQSTTARSLNIGPVSIPLPGPGQSPHPLPGVPGGLVTPPGSFAPQPGALQQPLLEQGQRLVGSILGGATGALQGKIDDITRAVLDVGGSPPPTSSLQSLQDQLSQGVQQIPTTVNDLLQSNALTASGIPNIGGKALDLGQYLSSPQSVTDLSQNGPIPAFMQNLRGLGQDLSSTLGPYMPMGVLDSMQAISDLNQKYAGTPGALSLPIGGQPMTMSVDPSVMTPEDRQRYQQAQFAVGGLEMPEMPNLQELLLGRLRTGPSPIAPPAAVGLETAATHQQQLLDEINAAAQQRIAQDDLVRSINAEAERRIAADDLLRNPANYDEYGVLKGFQPTPGIAYDPYGVRVGFQPTAPLEGTPNSYAAAAAAHPEATSFVRTAGNQFEPVVTPPPQAASDVLTGLQNMLAGREPAAPIARPQSEVQADLQAMMDALRGTLAGREPPARPVNPFSLLTETAPGASPMAIDDVVDHLNTLGDRYDANDARIAELENRLGGDVYNAGAGGGGGVLRPPWAVGWTNNALRELARVHGVDANAPLWWERVGLVSGSGELRYAREQVRPTFGGGQQTLSDARVELAQLQAEQQQIAEASQGIEDNPTPR